MSKPKIDKDNLTPAQKKVKQGRPVYYEGEKKNCEPEIARDIIFLYVTCGMGYSAARHVTGGKSDKLIEDVIRQHGFGRKSVDGDKGELQCPGSYTLSEKFLPLVRDLIKKYGTGNDSYNIKMLETGECRDDPLCAKKIKECPKCHADWDESWNFCPQCGWKKYGDIQKKLFDPA